MSRCAKSGEFHIGPGLSRKLVSWFNVAKRDLPWRNTVDPYRIWISEIMLQQTTVAAVGPYYERFLSRFPDVRCLAAADLEDVLACWAGLGYYRRAKLLHMAAQDIVTLHASELPNEVKLLKKLPGFGDYTAGAVASFAYAVRTPVVDANIARVLARIFCITQPLSSGTARRLLWQAADEILPRANSKLHNYALMELGALVCRPVVPECDVCPVRKYCGAFANQLTRQIPVPEKRPEKVSLRYACLAVRMNCNYGIRLIPEGEWHAGLYEFPKFEIAAAASETAIATSIEDQFPGIQNLRRIGELSYTVTHHSIGMEVWLADAGSAKKTLPFARMKWMTLEDMMHMPMGSAQKRVLTLLKGCG